MTATSTCTRDAASNDIESSSWWLIPGAAEIDDGEFCAEMKAAKSARNPSTAQPRCRWLESGALEHLPPANGELIQGRNPSCPIVILPQRGSAMMGHKLGNRPQFQTSPHFLQILLGQGAVPRIVFAAGRLQKRFKVLSRLLVVSLNRLVQVP